MVIVDECHHVSSVSFEQVLKQVRAHYVYGLTATPIRKDGHQPVIFMQCGKIRYTSDAKSQMDRQRFIRTLIPRFTSFRNVSSETKTYTQTLEALSTDEVRNKLIIEDVRKTVNEGRTPIILTDLTSRCSLFTFLAYSTLLYKSVRGAFQNVGGKLREIHLADSVAVGNPFVPRLFACFPCRNSVPQRYE